MIFIFFVARADNHKLHAQIHNLFGHALHKVKTFMRNKARNHRNHRNIGILLKSQILLERELVILLFKHLAGFIVHINIFILIRIENIGVYAVCNSAQFI